MARTRTLAQLRQEVRQRADLESSNHVTDSEVNRYVNQSCAALHGLIAEADEDYLTVSTTITTVAGTGTYAFTGYRIRWVEAVINGLTVRLDRWRFDQRDQLINAATRWTSTGAIPLYRYVRGQISLLPVPDGAYSVTIWHIDPFADLTLDSDTFNGEDGWEEWVVLDAAIKCLTKEESDPSALMAERQRVEQRIRAALGTRDHARPDTAVDTDPNARWWTFGRWSL